MTKEIEEQISLLLHQASQLVRLTVFSPEDQVRATKEECLGIALTRSCAGSESKLLATFSYALSELWLEEKVKVVEQWRKDLPT